MPSVPNLKEASRMAQLLCKTSLQTAKIHRKRQKSKTHKRKCAAKNLKPSVFRNGDKLVAEHGSKSVTFLFRVESV